MKKLYKQFEDNIKAHSLMNSIMAIKIPENVQTVHNKFQGLPQIRRKKTEFDFCAGINGRAVFFDAKCLESKDKFYFQSYLLAAEKIHQWENLTHAQRIGNIAGFLFWFVRLNRIAWADVLTVQRLMDAGHTYLDPSSPGVVSQSDSEPIDLRRLVLVDKMSAHP